MSRSNFARSQSKVWFGNEPDAGPYGGFRPYGFHLHSGPMSRPAYPAFHDLEEEDELIDEQRPDGKSTSHANSWAETNRQGSPASHKSQDSGFSDTETSPNAVGGPAKGGNNVNESQASSGATEKLTPKRSVNEELFTRSPSLNSSIPTPPTVIRRPPAVLEGGQTEPTQPGRRLSYGEGGESLGTESPRSSSLKRGRVITKNSRVKRNLSEQLSNTSEEMISLDSSELSSILSRTERNGEDLDPEHPKQDANNNEARELPTYAELYPTRGTSTPIRAQAKLYHSLPISPGHRTTVPSRPIAAPSGAESFYDEPLSMSTSSGRSEHALSYTIYDNPLLNGHQPAVQGWLDGLRFSCQSEVMSILQTKSIATEAGRSLRLTSAVAVKIVRHLQGKVTALQGSFERVEKLFAAIRKYQSQRDGDGDDEDQEEDEKEIYQKVAPFVHGLATDIDTFVRKQQSTDYFGREPPERDDRRKFVENVRALADMTADLRVATAGTDTFDHRSVEEEVQILKRYFLITVRLIFKHLVRVVVDAVEAARCELILRSNLTYVATLSNLDYGGLASLNDAFHANGTVRVLLLVCVESKLSSVRALALRALATVCSTTESIRQLERADGLEVLRDILAPGDADRTEPELREAVSVLTQISAPWHGDEHRLEGLKQHVHALVEAITEIIAKTACCQTLLLCSASLNNMTRIEPTAVYSVMSQDTVERLKTAIEQRGPGASIFLYEQFTATLYNMSANWKCHHHLASRSLLVFLVTVLGRKFPERLPSRVESEAQRKTIRNILHVLSRLLASGNLSSGPSLELIESTIGPVLARIERTLDGDSEHFRDLTHVSRRCSETLATRTLKDAGEPPGQVTNRTTTTTSTKTTTTAPHVTRLTIRRDPVDGPVMVLDKNRQESYV